MNQKDSKLPLPNYLIIEITTECNFKCKQCHQWMTKETDKALSTQQKLRAIEEIAGLNPLAKIMLTGGETMQKQDEFFAICDQARRFGLKVIANTNGSYINDSNMLDVVKNGPDFLLLSLDSHIEELHRFLRGTRDSYQHLLTIIPKMISLRNQHGLSSKIFTHSIIFKENIEHWEDYIEFSREKLKVDGVYFQLLKETLRNKNDKDPFFEKHFFDDIPKADSIISKIIQKYKSDSFMGAVEFDLQLMKNELYRPKNIELGVCTSSTKNIFIDSYGWVQLCMNMNEILPLDFIGNYKDLTIEEIWNSSKASEARNVMSQCSKNCGMLNCHRKSSNESNEPEIYY